MCRVRLVVLLMLIMFTCVAFAQDAENVELIGSCLYGWGMAYDVAVVGDLAYVAAMHSGLLIVDVSNPENPQIIGVWSSHRCGASVTVSGDYAYLTGLNRFVIVNISDPENPECIGVNNTAFLGWDIAVSGDYAYVADLIAGLLIFDISSKENPELVVEYNTSGDAQRVCINGDYAYITHRGDYMEIVNISDPEHPERVCLFDCQENTKDITVCEDYAYLTCNDGGLQILNVSDPEQPVWVGQYDALSNTMGVTILDDYAFIADGSSGLQIVNISDPEHPEWVGQYDTPGIAQSIAVSGDFAYIADFNNGLQIVNISDFEHPYRTEYLAAGHVCDVTTLGDYAYVAYGRGLQVVDIRVPEQPQVIGQCDTPGVAHGIAIFGNYAFIAGGGSLQILDISNPAQPEWVCQYETPGQALDVAVLGDYAYIADGEIWNGGDIVSSGLQIVNISDPEHPEWVGQYITPGNACGVTVSGDYVYIADDHYYHDTGVVGGGVQVLNISDPEHPKWIGLYADHCYAYCIAISGDYAYMATYPSGFQIMDISFPERPEIIGQFDVPNTSAYGIAVSGDYAYVAGVNSGLQVMDIRDPENPRRVGFYDTLGTAAKVDLSDDGLIYVADGTNMGIYRFTDPADVDDAVDSVPSEYQLLAAYPNPFNSTTTIGYSLPAAGIVSMAVYDLSGREVARLVNSAQPAGTHEAVWVAEGVSSGVYVIALEAGEVSLREKVVLVK